MTDWLGERTRAQAAAMADLDRGTVAVRTAVVVGFLVLVIVLGRTLLIADAWPGGWRWFFVSALAAAIVLSVLFASGPRDGGRRR